MQAGKSPTDLPAGSWRGRSRLLAGAMLAVLATLVAGVAAARGEEEPGVARVSLIEGQASYLRGDADDWTSVAVNAPLVTGDRFFSGADSRAEIQLDPAVYARLSSETEVSMLELGPDATQVRVTLGLATFRVRRDPADRHVEIDTPGAALVVREAGVYRVEVDPQGNTNVQVRDGEVTAYVAEQPYRLGAGRGAEIVGIADAARPRIFSVAGEDAWDAWETQRARRVDGAESYRYVSGDVYGAEDLDQYGDWESHPEYGHVWRPARVAADWAPYTTGRWIWVDPWGWTWLDYQPWGWAPFHYGRWVYLNSYWAWAPGPIVVRPTYAPALVGWFGAGFGVGGVSVSVGFGPSVGWVPLGWGEPCFPWWGGWGGVWAGRPWWGGWGGPRVVNNFVINKTVVNINVKDVHFRNLRHPRGFSTVPVRDFLGGRRGRHMPVEGGRPGDFRPIGGRVPLVPTRDSLPATNPGRVNPARAAQPPEGLGGRRVVTARTPSAGQPSFARKLPAIARGDGAPLTPTTLRQMAAEGGRQPATRRAASFAAGSDASASSSSAGRRVLPSTRDVASSYPTVGSGDASGTRSRDPRQLPSSGLASTTTPRARSAERGSGPATSPLRPPTLERDARSMPVAPRAGGGDRTPYVARRPTSDSTSGSPRATTRSTSEGFSRSTAPVERGGSSVSRSGADGGGSSVSRGRSAPGAARAVETAPRVRSAPPTGGSPSTGRALPAAPPPHRDSSAQRSYFSQPRTVTRGSSSPPTVSRSQPGSRSTPPSSPSVRSAPAVPQPQPQSRVTRGSSDGRSSSHGGSPGSSSSVRRSPTRSGSVSRPPSRTAPSSAPAVSRVAPPAAARSTRSAPTASSYTRSAPTRSAPSAPSYSRSAPSAAGSRGFSSPSYGRSGLSGGPRSFGGSGGSVGGSRSFGGSLSSRGGGSFGGSRSR